MRRNAFFIICQREVSSSFAIILEYNLSFIYAHTRLSFPNGGNTFTSEYQSPGE